MSLLSNRRRERRVADSVITSPEQHTTMDAEGSVRSIQAAYVEMPAHELEAVWTPAHLERLARTYWRYLSRVSLGLIRVSYAENERAVVFLTRPFVLLRFQPPEYELSATRGIVRWRIRDGLLVARRGHGHLEIDVRRVEAERPGHARVHVEVEVANFYPALAHFIARWFYAQTQSRIHVIVTHGFLKSLARLELEESSIGRFRDVGPALTNGNGRHATEEHPGEEVTIGDTPWGVVAAIGIAATLGVAAALALLRARDQ